jgi:hypothetical protein
MVGIRTTRKCEFIGRTNHCRKQAPDLERCVSSDASAILQASLLVGALAVLGEDALVGGTPGLVARAFRSDS